MFSLADKIAVVTGAGSGIGQATAELFARAGAFVYVADLNPDGAMKTLAHIVEAGGRGDFVQVNVADEASCQALAQHVLLKNNNRCDVLVNNAGIGHVGTILTTTGADMDRLWGVNLKGMFYLSKAILPAMIARGKGSIVNIASIAGVVGMYDRLAYTTTKHAVVGLTRAMALDHGTTQVRVNAICPGRVETPFVAARLAEYPDPQKYRDQMTAPHAQKRMAAPAEIAAAALYLAADESAFVTGSAMMIDGGYTTGK
jgi:2-keto-3-deoxy-L-fuconate dehydrogenase